ncbi:CLIP-associated protein [Vitis vinifera]|uniref:CLIP-associated protein n=1 Tax=Vitis vinifera TaxID=29760 RepID=A0A438KDB2_VITVI|nr:CLIP-associated protein [Vitis vinifera]
MAEARARLGVPQPFATRWTEEEEEEEEGEGEEGVGGRTWPEVSQATASRLSSAFMKGRLLPSGEEMYTQAGPQFRDELQRHHLPTSMLRDINIRLERIEPKIRSSDGLVGNYGAVEVKPVGLNPKKSSPKAKNSTREMFFLEFPENIGCSMESLFFGPCLVIFHLPENDITEKPIDPIKVYSEKELVREIEKIASTLVPEKDWSIRIAAMQRVEGLVSGEALENSYKCCVVCYPNLLYAIDGLGEASETGNICILF